MRVLKSCAARIRRWLTKPEPAAEAPLPAPTKQPTKKDWEAKGFRAKDVELFHNIAVSKVLCKITYTTVDEQEKSGVEQEKSFTEVIFPIAPPPVPKEADGRTDSVTATDAYWAKTSDQARSTAKWLATALGAALLALVGTAPLSPLGGQEIDWVSGWGLLIGIGLFLLAVTIFMVLSVLVPGITTFSDLMKPIKVPKWWKWDHHKPPVSIPKARQAMAEKAAERYGVDLPIGVHSLNELGHRIRIEEMTLNKIAEELAKCTDKSQIEAWTKVKEVRGKWLQHLEDEAAQWVIVGSYLSIKVKSDRARSIGLFGGILGGALVIICYVGLQAPKVHQEAVTYVVLPSAAGASVTRTALGSACDVFTAVPIATDTANNKLTVYVTGGKNCTANQRIELPAKEIEAVNPAPAPTASKS